MTIQCRTGCGQQVGYTQYQFSDGFIYLLFTNEDGSAHHCSNIPNNYYDDWNNSYDKNGNKIIVNNYEDFFIDVLSAQPVDEDYDITVDFKLYESSNVNLEICKKYLEQTKVLSNVFPAPFYEIDPEKDNTVYSLTQLSECYFQLGKYDDALLALSIQNQITNDQMEHITNLQKNQKIIPINDVIPTVKEIQEKIQKIELMIKTYFRKFSIKEIFEFSELKRIIIEEQSRNQIILDNAKEKDEIDGLSLGSCQSILYYFKNKNKRTNKDKFPDWTASYQPHLMLIVQLRNDRLAHPTSTNLEEELTDRERISYGNSCDKLIRHLENMEQK